MSVFTGGMADESWKNIFLQPLQKLSPPYTQLGGVARRSDREHFEALVLIPELFLAFRFLSREASCLIKQTDF